MTYEIDEIVEGLKQARINKGLTQRGLSAKAGVPQSHISKIESGAVDIKVSSLIELARTLDLELMLIPRRHTTAVKSIVGEGASQHGGEDVAPKAQRELTRLQTALSNIQNFHESTQQVRSLYRTIESMRNMSLDQKQFEQIKDISNNLRNINEHKNLRNAIEKYTSILNNIRNMNMHAQPLNRTGQRPAYQLDDDDEEGIDG